MDNNPGIYGMVSGTTNYTWDGNLLSATNTVNTAKYKSFPVVCGFAAVAGVAPGRKYFSEVKTLTRL